MMQSSKKILIICPSLEMPGGVANYYKALKKYFFEGVTYFIVGKRPGEDSIFKTISRLVNDYRSFKKAIRKNKYDLVVINPSLDKKSLSRDKYFIKYAHSKGIKTVTFFRGWSQTLAESFFENDSLIKSFMLSSAIITLSQESKDVLKKLGYKNEIFIETTTVEDDLLSFQKQVVNKKPGISILVLSRIEKSKGIVEAIETFKLLKQNHQNISLTIAGDGSFLDEAKRMVTEQNIGGIMFPGFVTGQQKFDSYTNADIYFFPSYHNEGMPNSVLEAMGFGLPVVSRRVGGLADFFENGKMGFITDSKDPKEFAALVEALISNPAEMEDIGAYNKTYSKRFLASEVTARLLQIFESV